ncbi:hypothetical protein P153DRAFT_381912 [Dothidotthia symphoricarpi CBS 119687]|uniref:Uncharacterized protein n=1 Tax=Dothidotthia symphoricarpi CBS 119687 TaxID=1392245 RepID=A0A6A6ANB1_9PLEO|nr:uncharacterized protein P153DRAFT_381912 [Dothidotthia symphoricarpi CBS 119687]KAF2133482.1 hypothetical protein P153DRAFT_381912 [Dothidotthia symphoricarpi CBS 119687]
MNLSAFRPAFRPLNQSVFRNPCLFQRTAQPQQHRTPSTTSAFSSTSRLEKRSKGGSKNDPRITSIRYHLSHPLTPRPLLFSRNRHLRHWTIHRAWLLFLRKRRWAEERDLERQYMSMRDACEHLRLLDSQGNRVGEMEAGGQGPDAGRLGVRGKDVGRLYRSAMLKRGVWGSVPVEYARMQTDFPGREGWNHGWTRN